MAHALNQGAHHGTKHDRWSLLVIIGRGPSFNVSKLHLRCTAYCTSCTSEVEAGGVTTEQPHPCECFVHGRKGAKCAKLRRHDCRTPCDQAAAITAILLPSAVDSHILSVVSVEGKAHVHAHRPRAPPPLVNSPRCCTAACISLHKGGPPRQKSTDHILGLIG